MHRSDRGREGGFSLIETILVIMLMGIIAALAIPRFPTIPKKEAVATILIRDIRYAKQLADRLQTMCGVYFFDCDGPCTSYRVFQDDDINKATLGPTTGTDFVVTLSGRFSGVTIESEFGTTLKFDSLGTPIDGSNNPLTVTGEITVHEGPENIIIYVIPNTGRVSLTES